MARMSSNDGVIDLTAHRRSGSADCFAELETYWQTLCAGRIMPYRDEVDPRGLAGALQNVFLVERIAPGMAQFRLAGQHLVNLMGTDLRGMPLGAMFSPQGRNRIEDSLHALFDEPARVELTLDGGRFLLRKQLTARMLLLPLRDRDGIVRRGVGCFAASSGAIRTPQTFDIMNETRRTLVGYGTLPTEPPATAGGGEHARPDVAARRTPTAKDRRAALRLVASN